MGGVAEMEGKWTNGRGQTLKTYSYTPSEFVRCVLFFHHGYGEYSGRKDLPNVFRALAEAGCAVHTYDCHGHGHSEPREEWDRHLIWDFNHVVDDYQAFTKSVRMTYEAGTPMFCGGHSMGSLASIHLALRDQSAWDGLILGTATVDVEWNWLLRLQASIGSVLAMLIPRARIVPAPPADVDADDSLAKEIAADPLLASGNVRARTANELLKAFAHVQAHGHRLALPIYSHHGLADQLASIKAVRALLDRCASTDVTLHEIEGGAHELFIGLERELVTGHILAWLEAHLPPASQRTSCSSEGELPLACSPRGGSPQYLTPLSSPRGEGPASIFFEQRVVEA